MKRIGKLFLAVLPGLLLAIPAWYAWPPAAAGVLGAYLWIELSRMTAPRKGGR